MSPVMYYLPKGAFLRTIKIILLHSCDSKICKRDRLFSCDVTVADDTLAARHFCANVSEAPTAAQEQTYGGRNDVDETAEHSQVRKMPKSGRHTTQHISRDWRTASAAPATRTS